MENIYVDIYKRVWGSSYITGEIEVDSSSQEILITTDVTSYPITVPTGKYTTSFQKQESDIIDELKAQVQNIPVEVQLGFVHNSPKYCCIVFKMNNEETITDITGSFAEKFFSGTE